MEEEIAQSVFAVLARRAAGAASSHFVGWLHRTTVFEALRRGRSEIRHRRKIAALATAMTPPTDEPPPAWLELLPLLDDSLQRLRTGDRQVLIMRFFEDLSYTAIAAATGKSEEAAKKQTTRALDRLRDQLRRRGVTCSTAGLTGLLSVQGITPSASAAPTLAAASLQSASSVTWTTLARHSLHHMNTLKLAGAASLVLLGLGPIVWQERSIAAAQQELMSLEKALLHSSGSPPIPPPIPRPNPAAIAMDIEQLARDVEATESQGILSPSPVEATARLNGLHVEALQKLFDDVPTLSGGLTRQRSVRLWLYKRLSANDPLLAIRIGPEMLRLDPSSSTTVIDQLRESLLTLLKTDPDAALREYHALRDSRSLDGKGSGSTAYVVYGPFVGAMMTVNPEVAKELYAGLDTGGRLNALNQATTIDSPELRAFVLSEIPKLEPRWQPQHYSSVLASDLKWRGLDGAATVLRELQLPSDIAVPTLASFLQNTNSGQAGAQLSIVERLDWLRKQLPPDLFAEAGGQFLGRTFELSAASDELQKQRNIEFRAYDWGAYRDQAIAALFKPEKPPDDAAEALSLAVEIRDPALRMGTLQRLARRFKNRPTSYQAAIETTAALTPDEKSRIFQP